MAKNNIIFLLGLFVLSVTSLVIILGIEPKEISEFTPKGFPELEEIAVTVLHLDESMDTVIGSDIDSYNRNDFYGDLTIEYKGVVDEYSAVLRKRGATSFLFEKPQFSVSFINDEQEQVNKKLLDMPKGEDWVLNGPLLDRSLLRNYLAYKTSSEIMPYAPRAQYTELYVQVKDQELEYLGLYLWIEKIRRDENRVNINTSLINQEATSFIVEKNSMRDGDKIFSVYGKELYMYPYVFTDVYPKQTLSEEQANYIGDVLTVFERVLYHDKYDVPGEGYREIIDVNSFIDYYIINEFFLNTDAGLKSTYFYKDIRGKLNIGPVWDFNNAMGNVNTVFNMHSYKGLFMHDRAWFERLLQDPTFTAQVIARYEVLRRGPLSTEKLLDEIDAAYKILKPYADKDHSKYSEDTVYTNILIFLELADTSLIEHVQDQNQFVSDFEGEIEVLKNFITNRALWLDEHIKSIQKWTE